MSSSLASAQINKFRNSFDSTAIEVVTLAQALSENGASLYEANVRHLRRVLARQGKAAYNRAKATLPAVTFGGVFHPSRGNAYLQRHSGIVHGDLDHLDDVLAVKHAICGDPRTAYVFISPSGSGLKLGVRVDLVPDDAGYKHAWHTVSAEYERLYGGRWDASGKDVSRLCFVSDDRDLYTNFDAAVCEVPPPALPKPQPSPPRVFTPRIHHSGDDYGARAIRTAVAMIQSAQPGARHHERLRASRLLGGYIGAGLLTEDQAFGALAQALIGHTEELAKALKTVHDGLNYGKAAPFSLDALEAERLDRLRMHRSIQANTRDWPADYEPWDGMDTTLLRPYRGYRGLMSRRRGKGEAYGTSK